MALFGGGMILESLRQRRDLQNCTARVTAYVVDMGKIRHRRGYLYFYKVRYTWQEKPYTVEFSSHEWLGERGEETVLNIDPEKPDKCRVDCSKVGIVGNMTMGLSLIGVGLIMMIGGIFLG